MYVERVHEEYWSEGIIKRSASWTLNQVCPARSHMFIDRLPNSLPQYIST